jgi:hypothetical protein
MSRKVWALPVTVCSLVGVLAFMPIAEAAAARTGEGRANSREARLGGITSIAGRKQLGRVRPPKAPCPGRS